MKTTIVIELENAKNATPFNRNHLAEVVESWIDADEYNVFMFEDKTYVDVKMEEAAAEAFEVKNAIKEYLLQNTAISEKGIDKIAEELSIEIFKAEFRTRGTK